MNQCEIICFELRNTHGLFLRQAQTAYKVSVIDLYIVHVTALPITTKACYPCM